MKSGQMIIWRVQYTVYYCTMCSGENKDQISSSLYIFLSGFVFPAYFHRLFQTNYSCSLELHVSFASTVFRDDVSVLFQLCSTHNFYDFVWLIIDRNLLVVRTPTMKKKIQISIHILWMHVIYSSESDKITFLWKNDSPNADQYVCCFYWVLGLYRIDIILGVIPECKWMFDIINVD